MGKLLLFVLYLIALAGFGAFLMAIYRHYKDKNKNKK